MKTCFQELKFYSIHKGIDRHNYLWMKDQTNPFTFSISTKDSVSLLKLFAFELETNTCSP